MLVAQAVGRLLAQLGVDHVFGLVGSGNFHATNALVAAGARFVPAAHEAGAATMADAYARVSGQPCVLSVHQGPGVTNAFTGITEAAKSRTPLLVLTPEATNPRSNFHLDLPGLASGIGADFLRLEKPADVFTAWQAVTGPRPRTVLLGLPLEVQAQQTELPDLPPPPGADESTVDIEELLHALRGASKPVFIAGRGATRARYPLTQLADRCGALLATSAAAKGLFEGDPWNLDVSGGFASPLAASLISQSDLVVAWGSTLNMWTTRHGRLIPASANVVQVDLDPAAIGVNHRADLGVIADVARVASEALAAFGDWSSAGWRDDDLRATIAAQIRWCDVPYPDESTLSSIDPRTFTIALDALLPRERIVAIDSGNFMGYPSMFLSVPDNAGFCFTQAFQSVGLGLASAIGAALARPDRLPVAALGDGGFLMSLAELTTVIRLRLPMVIVVYNDAAFGAEVHHFGPDGHPLDTVTFPDSDLAAIARGFGCTAITVRTLSDLDGAHAWLAGPRDTPLLIDAKVRTAHGSWWLEEAFRGH
ncbi:acetolactate synthase I/II/III large subunit [Rhizocola hellebori]|uniref:Acetolactate synthase I/II/III large subunit n=1 Tax=Rhizocola hellebori TaxID=1392758 RepID=A0A8J3Q9X8_9ACTN|nr:thiamine pyrophosphate-binding protein [Rhizocola hellebori]GIH05750.1 acetolactate synthase I/II/III large subunit [Rhizocola hellebori]